MRDAAMRVVLLCLLSLQSVLGQSSTATMSVEKHIKDLEHQWAQATVRGDVSAVGEFEAEDITFTDADGHHFGKAKDLQDLRTGNDQMPAIELTDLKVQVYGNTAIATGVNITKWTHEGRDVSGRYRFTDTWIQRDGRWKVIASQITKVKE